MRSRPAIMQNYNTNSNLTVPSGVYGQHHADADIDMPQPLRTARYGAVDDNDQHLRQERYQPNEHQFASVTSQSAEPDQCSESDCDGSHHAKCLCTSANANSTGCICTNGSSAGQRNDTNRIPTPKPNEHGNFRCPKSGKLCSSDVCDGWCKGDS